MRSSKNVSLNKLFPRFHGFLGIAIDNWVWYRRIGGGRGDVYPPPGSRAPGASRMGFRRNILIYIKRNWCPAVKKF